MIYIVIGTADLGGAEKRFVGLWAYLRRGTYDRAHLVVSRELFERLQSVDEFSDALARYATDVVVFGEAASLRSLRRCLATLWLANRTAAFHFVMVSPVLAQAFPSRRTLFSMTAATWAYSNAKGVLVAYAGMLAARHVDVLDESVCNDLKRQLPFKRDRITLTPNSFVDLDHYSPAPFAQKRALITFLGLFSRDKGVFRLLQLLPELDERLRSAGVDAEFRLMGRDVASPGIVEACHSLPPSIRVTAGPESNPSRFLAQAKVFLSLQQTTNYPSKSLLEAMASGALPVVTDVRDSRLIAPEDVAFYVPRAFSACDLASHIVTIVQMPERAFEDRVARARQHLAKSFSAEAMARYYVRIYDEISERSEA